MTNRSLETDKMLFEMLKAQQNEIDILSHHLLETNKDLADMIDLVKALRLRVKKLEGQPNLVQHIAADFRGI